MPHSVRSTGLPILARSRANSKVLPRSDIFHVGAAIHLISGVIAPFVRIADLEIDGVEFLDGLLARGGAHPVERREIVVQRGDQIVDHAQGARLGFRREIALHVILSESFAEFAVGGLDAALPARKHLFAPVSVLAVEVEIFVDELFGTSVRATEWIRCQRR